MRHSFYLPSKLHIAGLTTILLFVMLLSIIAIMWVHIRQQDEIILNLIMKVSEIEHSKASDKATIRTMCLHELFDRIDNAEKMK